MRVLKSVIRVRIENISLHYFHTPAIQVYFVYSQADWTPQSGPVLTKLFQIYFRCASMKITTADKGPPDKKYNMVTTLLQPTVGSDFVLSCRNAHYQQ